ncbi:alpha-N-arabinofuranosidase [Microlunatus speluncae]|uniref:alpha-N-arabinofuranosidase n=1 Tax=Microlunatus speluncae TaxID=2594267 RepID=UPI0012662AEB|nr:alpha-L-arabinofuranosidase C-terminal domain-containing protein [Microlunatus speluncae]
MTAVRLSVLPEEPIGRIAPELHGQFAEHLGELIYPGIWVGPDSSVPNVDGLRTDVIEALKGLRIPVLRWPGGCFADDYHWRDGIGPREDRPTRLNIHWGMAEEPNAFGTHEFLAFAKAIGAEPYLATNLGSGTPQEMRDWIEYCNHPSGTTLSDERRANGAEDPFDIRWWGIGNENWGCGGNLTPEFYAEEYARYRTFAFPFGGTVNAPVACGPNGWDWPWTRRFFDQIARGTRGNRLDKVEYFAAHYYCRTAGTATEYTDAQWLELLTKAIGIEGVITGHRAIMDGYDPDRRIGLILDEWGTWHPPQEGKPPRGLYQQNTIRDACVAALSLDIFHNHADKLVMANIAQLINVLQAMLLVDETRVVATPTYHVFALYAEHQGGTALRVVSDAPVISNGEDGQAQASLCYEDKRTVELRAVSGSASVRDGRLCLTLVNADPNAEADVELTVRGGAVSDATMITLATDDIHDHNTFEDPDRVAPGAAKSVAGNGSLRLTLPAASVSRITGRL